MQKRRNRKHLACLLAVAVVLSFSGIGSSIEAMANSKNTAVLKSVSLKIENKKVTKKTYEMKQGDKKKIKVSVSPKKGKKTIIFSTSNKKVAAVNKNGSVTAQNAGTAKITVTVREEKAGKSSGTVKKETWVKIKVTPPSSDKKEDTAEPPAASSIPEVLPTPKVSPTPEVPPASTATDSPSPTPVGTPDISENRKSIVVYFSCTANTKTIAEYVAEGAGADIYRIEPSVPYTSTDLNYNNSDSRTSKEQNDALARPEIAGELPSLEGYENVYLGASDIIRTS